MNLCTVFIAILIAAAPLTTLAQGITKDSLVIEGKKRTYYLYVPASAKTAAPAPLLVLLHGSGRDGLLICDGSPALNLKACQPSQTNSLLYARNN